jgi:hypothetical protein
LLPISETHDSVIFFDCSNEMFGSGRIYSTNVPSRLYTVTIDDSINDNMLDIFVNDLNQDNYIGIIIAYYGTKHVETIIKMF